MWLLLKIKKKTFLLWKGSVLQEEKHRNIYREDFEKSAIKLEYKYIKSDGFSKCDQSFEVRKVKLGKPQHALLVLNTENHTC